MSPALVFLRVTTSLATSISTNGASSDKSFPTRSGESIGLALQKITGNAKPALPKKSRVVKVVATMRVSQ